MAYVVRSRILQIQLHIILYVIFGLDMQEKLHL